MKQGSKVKFAGEADEIPGTIPGDVIISIQEKEHELFKRKGADLVYDMELSLTESLTGFTKTITHLDGRVLRIDAQPGVVTKHDAVRMISNEGMPFQGNPFTKGRLFIHFSVKFPTTLSPSLVTSLKNILPKAPVPMLSGEEEECVLVDVDISQFGQSGDNRRGDATEEDEDDGRGAQRVQCGQA
jgi:DnaJ family protein A protein 2